MATDKQDVVEKLSQLLESSPERNFVESIELAVNLKNIDLSVPANRVEDEVLLPKGRGKRARIGVFGSGEMAVKARGVADVVIQPEDIEDLAGDKKQAKQLAQETDFFVAEAPLMPTIGRTLGPVLGPRGKMPKPVPPGADPASQVDTLRNTTRMRSRDKTTFHVYVGTRDMPVEDLAENVMTVLDRLIKTLDKHQHNVGSVYATTTMGGSVRIL